MPVTTLKKLGVRKNPSTGLVRPKRPCQPPQVQLRSPPAGAQPLAEGPSAARALATVFKRLDASLRNHAALTDEELGDLVVEALLSSPVAAARVNAKLAASHPVAAADPREAGLVLVRQMQQAEGGAWTGAQLRARFGLSAATLHRRRVEHRIVYWRDAQGVFLYPGWQFTPVGSLLPGVQKVLQTLRSSDEWRLMRYFLVPRQQLDGASPLGLLRRGEKDKVIAHAHVHGQENTW